LTNASRALAALGDATRREIFDQLAEGPTSVGALAAKLPVSRPAVSQHLRVLKEAGLVEETPDGARRIYRLDPRGIGAMRDWLDQHWDRALAAFKDFVEDPKEPDE